MDRFIAQYSVQNVLFAKNLKSNMDRFIENSIIFIVFSFFNLKSNMDRFIDGTKFPTIFENVI